MRISISTISTAGLILKIVIKPDNLPDIINGYAMKSSIFTILSLPKVSIITFDSLKFSRIIEDFLLIKKLIRRLSRFILNPEFKKPSKSSSSEYAGK